MAIPPPPTPFAWTRLTLLHYNCGVGMGQDFFLAPQGEIGIGLDFLTSPCSISVKDLVSITKYFFFLKVLLSI